MNGLRGWTTPPAASALALLVCFPSESRRSSAVRQSVSQSGSQSVRQSGSEAVRQSGTSRDKQTHLRTPYCTVAAFSRHPRPTALEK